MSFLGGTKHRTTAGITRYHRTIRTVSRDTTPERRLTRMTTPWRTARRRCPENRISGCDWWLPQFLRGFVVEILVEILHGKIPPRGILR